MNTRTPPKPADAPTSSKPLPPAAVAQLTDLIDQLTVAHERLLVEACAHREALRRADGAGVERCARAQGDLLSRIADLEGRRRELTALHAPGAGGEVTLTALAARTPRASRDELLRRTAALRDLMARVQDEHRTIAAASKALIAHMEGLMRQVGRVLSHAQTYGRRGVVEPGTPVVTSLDLAC